MKKLLIVDDNDDLRYSIKRILCDSILDLEIYEAKDGKECLDHLKNDSFDLILLDIMMPVMDGWTTAAHIRDNEKTQGISIIFMTAQTDSVSKEIGLITAKDYIEKPFDNEDFIKRINKVIYG